MRRQHIIAMLLRVNCDSVSNSEVRLLRRTGQAAERDDNLSSRVTEYLPGTSAPCALDCTVTVRSSM